MPGPLSDEKLAAIRRLLYKFDYHVTKDEVRSLLDTIDALKEGRVIPSQKVMQDAAARYLDDLGATHWPSTSWTIKGSDGNLALAAEWLAQRTRAVLKRLEPSK